MKELDDAGKSFIRYMRGRDEQGLRNYANLMYAGLAAVPGLVASRAEFFEDLLPYVSKCETCGKPVQHLESLNDGDHSCPGCLDLYWDVRLATMRALEKHRHDGFYCPDLLKSGTLGGEDAA